jgi:hypothetical protein
MDWLSANWLWVVLGLGVAWLFFRGGMGCGVGGHGSHVHGSGPSKLTDRSRNEHPGEDGSEEPEDAAASQPSRHRGC